MNPPNVSQRQHTQARQGKRVWGPWAAAGLVRSGGKGPALSQAGQRVCQGPLLRSQSSPAVSTRGRSGRRRLSNGSVWSRAAGQQGSSTALLRGTRSPGAGTREDREKGMLRIELKAEKRPDVNQFLLAMRCTREHTPRVRPRWLGNLAAFVAGAENHHNIPDQSRTAKKAQTVMADDDFPLQRDRTDGAVPGPVGHPCKSTPEPCQATVAQSAPARE